MVGVGVGREFGGKKEDEVLGRLSIIIFYWVRSVRRDVV